MNAKIQWIAGAVIVLSATLAGCGGGGSNSASNGVALATKMRLLQPGDQWVYKVTGQGLNGASTVTATGTVTDTISSKPFQGGTALARESVTHVAVSDGNTIDFDRTLYFSQDSATGDILELGEQANPSEPIDPVVTPTKILFGSWSSGETLTTTLDFGGGDVQTTTKTIAGSESVQTPLGNFAAWKVTTPPVGNNTFTQDWAPQLGAPVKIAGSLFGYTNSTGGFTTITATELLQSTTVPH